MSIPKRLAQTVSGLTVASAGVLAVSAAASATADDMPTALQARKSAHSADSGDNRRQYQSGTGDPCINCNGRRGPQGPPGPPGPQGPQGPPGAPAVFSAEKWGIIGRNTYGSPSAGYRVGPYARTNHTDYAATVPPPYGIGSLEFIVGSTDKINYGNETDFAGMRVSDLTTLKFWVYTGADSISGVSPAVDMEVDPRLVVNGTTLNYASLVYLPTGSAAPSAPATPRPNVWQQYDATAAGSKWYATGATGVAISCPVWQPCSFSELKARLPDAVISYPLGFTKGRDSAFVGSVDGLQVNNVVYDFEPLGVYKRPEGGPGKVSR
jgi:hypothetical protein